ncbi:trna (adenine57-n1 adenine58-n1)-methyltransferase [Fusarium albosuccineum]|uniref:tRNA (adenine(58)-N(1))-methyltransferase catalytic subunit TRM61 n=1 Tax=Fusarium albosuccineum TaxID=1237068 RepID=A0A8H4LKP4_9HYPO|nr:trna (adenine57-n1 adenine58-n1)-methyltransferase [Fusarium albosuccineum]
MAQPSPFLEPGNVTTPGNLAIVLLSRDNAQPITLEQSTGAVDGYAEGATLNTRFGSFPHSTLLNIPWGSQVRASAVDTGSRGRKRRREATDEDTPTTTGPDEATDPTSKPVKKATAAASGFIHILRPTPEVWTSSLPHRTQVVYTPDYSYILQRLRVVPGTRIIEAGAGSGSFTHASARAVYNGYPKGENDERGKVFSFEFHEPRFNKMQEEIQNHRLEGIVKISHRDVYEGGFLVDGKSPRANAVFLDLPAPWEALHHLSRQKPEKAAKDNGGTETPEWVSPLDPKKSVYICTFSPCIEQVTRTIEELRLLGWTDIDMVEISHRRFNVIRERVGANLPAERGNFQSPGNVAEAVERLKEINRKTKEFHRAQFQALNGEGDSSAMDVDTPASGSDKSKGNEKDEDSKPWMHGKLFHRPEPELKTHTSYLTFAILPREWTEEDEAAAWEKWPCGKEGGVIGSLNKQARKQQTRDKLAAKKKQKQKQGNDTQAEAEAETK